MQKIERLQKQAKKLSPDASTTVEIVDTLEQDQITLPDGKLVLAQGKINNRILSSLVAAFNEGKPRVGSEELMAQDISIGIPLKKAKKTLYNSIFRLRDRTLMGTGWNIISVVDENDRRKTRGLYFLVKETPSTATEKTSMETMTLPDGKIIIPLNQRRKTMLQRIIESGDNGISGDELLDPETNRKTAKGRVRDDLGHVRAALNGTPFTIVNLTSKADARTGKRGRYVFMERSEEELAIIDQQRQNGYSLPKRGETTIFAANENADSVVQSPLEDPQDEEYDDEDTPQEIEDARQNNLKQQARLQLALNIFDSVRSGKLGTLEKDAVAYIQNSLPPGISVLDAKGFIIESINAGLYYWNLNDWDLGPNPSAQEIRLIETCRELRMGSLRSKEAKQRAIQDIHTHFSLPQDPLHPLQRFDAQKI